MNSIRLIAICTVALLVARGAGAQELEGPSFTKGTWALELSGSHGEPIRYSDEEVAMAAAGVGYYLLDNFAVVARGTFVAIDHEAGSFPEEAIGAGADVLLRWHFLNVEKWTFYIDGGGGRFWTDEPSPPGGTTYNWTGRVGLGATWKIGERTHLMGGARYYHYSNGDVHGRINNPGHDGVEGYVGLMFTW